MYTPSYSHLAICDLYRCCVGLCCWEHLYLGGVEFGRRRCVAVSLGLCCWDHLYPGGVEFGWWIFVRIKRKIHVGGWEKCW